MTETYSSIKIALHTNQHKDLKTILEKYECVDVCEIKLIGEKKQKQKLSRQNHASFQINRAGRIQSQ